MPAVAELPVMTQPVAQQLEYVGEHRAIEEEVATGGWRQRFGQIATRAALALGIAIGGTTAAEAVQPAPAQAHEKSIGACRGPFWGLLAQQICVNARMGEKDFANHREWVGNVEAVTPDAGPQFLEIWGDGFYKSQADATDANWDINKFVTSDTNICAAATDGEGFRSIACFHISVE